MSARLIIFTRYPTPGFTKTRLIPVLGPEGAAELHRHMTEHILDQVFPLSEEGIQLQILYEGGGRAGMIQWLGEDFLLAAQGDGDLGDRLRRAFEDSFHDGARSTVVVGTDCPSLGSADVTEAFDLLKENNLVLGPATDGGYYLIGIRSDAPAWLFDLIFKNIPWGTDQVFNNTMNVLSETGLDVGLLDEKTDVDEPEDLVHWEAVIGAREALPGTGKTDLKISVIIPIFNEEKRIGGVLEVLEDSKAEVVVADGGSTDQTLAVCRKAAVNVVHSKRSRAAQMNAGAMAATGDVFLFLHADTYLPDGFEGLVVETLLEGNVAGAFLFGTDMDTPGMRVIERAVHFRAFRLGIVFGDQAIFATREAFFRAGAFPEQAIMEDYELWRRLGKVGKRSIVPVRAITSARKWEEQGLWRLTIINQIVMWLYILGFGPERLDRWYRRKLLKADPSR